MWLAQSVDAPPKSVFSFRHGQVVITKATTGGRTDQALVSNDQVIGQQDTVKLCAAGSSGSADPWLHRDKDPWGSAIRPVQPCVSAAPQLQDIEHRIEQAVLAKLPAEKMETDEQEARIKQLEHHVHELAARRQSLEKLVGDNHQQQTIQAQSLQTQMASQLEVRRQHMDGLFKEQMARIEMLMGRPVGC